MNKNSSDMKETIRIEVMKVYDQEATVDEVVDKLLVLFGVSGSVADAIGRNCPFCGEPCVECSHKATDR